MKLGLVLALSLVACGSEEKPAPSAGKAEVDKPAAKPSEVERDSSERRVDEAAQKAADEAVKGAQEARATVDALEKQLETMSAELNLAIEQVAAAKSKDDLDTAKAKLAALQKARAEIQVRVAQSKADAAKADRTKGAKISKECQDNPLAKGCM